MKRLELVGWSLRITLVVGLLAGLGGFSSTALRLHATQRGDDGSSAPTAYQVVPDWPTLSDGRRTIGRMHGDIAVSSAGDVYVSVEDSPGGLEVYGSGGRFLRRVAGAPRDLHAFVIKKEGDGEFIYAVSMVGQHILKMTLDGRVVLTIPSSSIPERLRTKNPANLPYFVPPGDPRLESGEVTTLLTGIDVAPNGDIYVSDGYSADYIHRFDRSGRYLASFGGPDDARAFKQLHKLVIDTRFQPARILACDRGNRRLLHFTLDGEFIGVAASDLLRPSGIAIWRQSVAVAEAEGRISLLDMSGAPITRVSIGSGEGVGTNRVPPDQWRTGLVVAPHGIAVDPKGDIFVAEFNLFGRMHRFNRR